MFHGALQEDLAGDDGKRCPTYSDHHEGLLQRVTDLESTYFVVDIFFTEFTVALALMQPWSNQLEFSWNSSDGRSPTLKPLRFESSQTCVEL